MGNTTILRGDQIEGIESSQNFIKNLGERNTAGWVRYNDGGSNPSRPIDGIGGTPTSGLDVTLSATNPLAGDKSFVFSKPASNCQGQGFSYDFAIDRASRAKVLKIEFDYLVDSGTFNAGSNTVDSDLIVYIYDVDAGQVIEPSTFKLYANSTNITDRFSGYFQTSASSTNYRLIFHVATTNASAWSLKVDNVVVAPSKYVYGTSFEDWKEYTPTFNSGFTVGTGGAAFNKWYWRQVGDSVQIRGGFKFGTSGFSMGSGSFTASLPSGPSFDFGKLTWQFDRIGVFDCFDYGGTQQREVGRVFTVGTSNQFRFLVRRDDGGAGEVTANFPFTWGADDELYCQIEAPIQGWSSSVRMSDGYEGRDVVLLVGRTSGIQTITTTAQTKVTFPNVFKDSVSGWDASNNRYVVQTSGDYILNLGLYMDALNVNEAFTLGIKVNGTSVASRFFRTSIGDSAEQLIAVLRNLKAGDSIEAYVKSQADTSYNIRESTDFTFLQIVKLSSPQTIAMGEVVAGFATNSSGQVIPNASFTAVTNWTVVNDTHGIFNPTTGVLTVNKSGFIEIASSLVFNPNASGGRSSAIERNGSNLTINDYPTASGVTISVPISLASYPVKAGDTFKIKAFQNSGGNLSLAASALYNYISWRIY